VPVTPFHFGLGAAFHSVAPGSVSFISFCAANVFIDIEPLYYMLTGQFPLHRFFHTYVGATLLSLMTVMLFVAARWAAGVLPLPDVFGWQQLGITAVAVGASLGTYSHIVLDSIMHTDIRPFAPFSQANPLQAIVSLRALHLFCVVAAAMGIIVVVVRARRVQANHT
jgi:hypothetical protein